MSAFLMQEISAYSYCISKIIIKKKDMLSLFLVEACRLFAIEGDVLTYL